MGMLQVASAAEGAVTVTVEWNDSNQFARRVHTHHVAPGTAVARVVQDGQVSTYTVPPGDNEFPLANNRFKMVFDAGDGEWRLPPGLEVGLTVTPPA